MTKRKLAPAGWIVKAVTPSLGVGASIKRWFTVGEPQKVDAEMAAKKHPDAAEAAVDARRPLTDSELAALALRPGEVRKKA